MSSLKVSKPAPAARNIDLHFDTRDMVPFFTKIVDGVYHRPVVVTFLFPRNYCRKIRAISPSNISKADVNGVNGSILEESGDEIASPGKDYDTNEEEDAMSTDFYQQRIHAAIKHAKIAKHFVVTVTDVVESRDASYKVIVRDYKDLLKEIKEEYDNNVAVEDYFKPSSIRWWIAYIDQVLLVFDRPSGKLAALVDKGKIQSRVKRKMEHHLWMLEQLKNPSAGGNETLPGGGNMRGSIFEGSLKLSESTEELLGHFDQYPEDIPRDDRASPVLEGSAEGPSSNTADEVIDDHAIVGKDDPKPVAEIDQVVAVEVQEEIDAYSTIQPTGSVTANILDDLSLTQSQSQPEGEPSQLPPVTPTKKKSHSARQSTRQSTNGGSSSAASKTRLRSSMDNQKLPKTNDDGRGDSKPMHAPPSSASPSRHSSAFEKTRVRQSTSSPLRNSTSLPTIAHAEKVSKPVASSSNSVYQQSVSGSSVSTSPIVITISQERTNQLLESAYGVAATSKLFPAKYAREEELLRQSMQASLRPSSKVNKKRGSTAAVAAGSISSVSRSHEGKLPSISQGGNNTTTITTTAVADKSVASVKGSLFEYPVASFSASAPLATTNFMAASDENEMTISEIAHHVADRVNREILYNEHHEEQEGVTSDEGGGGVGGETGAVFDPQYDPYRQVAIATSFLSLERSVSPQPRPVSPFAEETKQLKGSKKVAAEIIHRARKSVSGSSKFQVRKISYSEKKLLDSPFAKKIWIEPVDDPSMTANNTHSSSSKSMVLPSPGSLESTGTMTPITSPERSPPSRDPASLEATESHHQHHRALPSATKKGSLVTKVSSSSSTTASSSRHGQKDTASKSHSKTQSHKERRSVDATPGTGGGDPSPPVVLMAVVEVDVGMSSAVSTVPPATDIEESPTVEQTSVEALPPSQNPSSKIIYLETDDSVMVGERLEMTIANLIPDAAVVEDGNDTANGDTTVNDTGYESHPAEVDPFIPAAVPEEEEPFPALQQMAETTSTEAEQGHDVVDASNAEAADPLLTAE